MQTRPELISEVFGAPVTPGRILDSLYITGSEGKDRLVEWGTPEGVNVYAIGWEVPSDYTAATEHSYSVAWYNDLRRAIVAWEENLANRLEASRGMEDARLVAAYAAGLLMGKYYPEDASAANDPERMRRIRRRIEDRLRKGVSLGFLFHLADILDVRVD